MLGLVDETGWRPGIGDPSIGGWITVIGYFVGALLCWREAMKSSPASKFGSERNFWLLFCLGLFALGINKQLDLQTWFTEFGKQLAKERGWYETRRIYQFVFIVGVALTGICAMGWLGWMIRGTFARNLLPLGGGLFLVCFVIMRAASFHNVDRMLGIRLAGLKVNWLCEWTGIALIIFGALRHSLTFREYRPTSP